MLVRETWAINGFANGFLVFLPCRNGHDYRFEIDSLKVNLKSGSFTIDPGEKDVMQMTCLAFVTATLYLLVQPRPKSVADAKNLNQRGSKRVTVLQCCAADTIEPLNVRGNKRVRLFLWSTWLMLTFLCVPFHTSKDLYFCKIAPMCRCKTQLLRNVLFVQCTMISKLL